MYADLLCSMNQEGAEQKRQGRRQMLAEPTCCVTACRVTIPSGDLNTYKPWNSPKNFSCGCCSWAKR